MGRYQLHFTEEIKGSIVLESEEQFKRASALINQGVSSVDLHQQLDVPLQVDAACSIWFDSPESPHGLRHQSILTVDGLQRLIERDTQQERPLTIADITVHPLSREVIRGEQSIYLTKKEFELLYYLIQHKGRVCRRKDILSVLWGPCFYGDPNLLDVYIRYVRKKIEDPSKPRLIHTIRGVGFLIKEPTTTST